MEAETSPRREANPSLRQHDSFPLRRGDRMAGLKKKKKDKSNNPNVVLVVFLVFFVLLSIGLGIWVYTERTGCEDMKKQRELAVKALPSEKARGTYYEMLYRDLRNAVGNKLDADEDKEFAPYF